MPDDSGRRVPGLRRDEVALLAGVSTDYYIRLEQGRERHPSEQVLRAIGRALRLDEAAAEHLFRLGLPGPAARTATTRVSDELLRLMDNLRDVPAFVVGPAQDILAANAMADALYCGFTRFDNLLRMIFLDRSRGSSTATGTQRPRWPSPTCGPPRPSFPTMTASSGSSGN